MRKSDENSVKFSFGTLLEETDWLSLECAWRNWVLFWCRNAFRTKVSVRTGRGSMTKNVDMSCARRRIVSFSDIPVVLNDANTRAKLRSSLTLGDLRLNIFWNNLEPQVSFEHLVILRVLMKDTEAVFGSGIALVRLRLRMEVNKFVSNWRMLIPRVLFVAMRVEFVSSVCVGFSFDRDGLT